MRKTREGARKERREGARKERREGARKERREEALTSKCSSIPSKYQLTVFNSTGTRRQSN